MFTTRQVVIDTSRDVILTGAKEGGPAPGNAQGRTIIMVKVPSGGVGVYIGGSTVTAATGFLVEPGETFWDESLGPGDDLYGITASGSATVYVLEQD